MAGIDPHPIAGRESDGNRNEPEIAQQNAPPCAQQEPGVGSFPLLGTGGEPFHWGGRMKSGYITLHRKFFDHWLWEEKREFSKAEAWIDLVKSAAFNDHSRIIRGTLITVGRGEIIASLRYLGERWGWKKDKVNSFVRLLESQTMIRRETRHGETVVILCNYDSYNNQTDDRPDSEGDGKPDTKPTVTRQPPDSDPTKENKGKKGNKENGTPLPPEGGDGGGQPRILPKDWRKLSATERKREKVNMNSRLMIRVGRFFGRPEEKLWSVAEALALQSLSPPLDELQMMEAYYCDDQIEKDDDIRRRDLITLLNNWPGELDRARAFVIEQGIQLPPIPT